MFTVDTTVHPDKAEDIAPVVRVTRYITSSVAVSSGEYVSVKVRIKGNTVTYFLSPDQYDAFRAAMLDGLDPANEELG